MSAIDFTQADETPERESLMRRFTRLLPTRAQVGTALLLDFGSEIGPGHMSADEHPAGASMRQVAGLIVVCALISGLLPFVANWYSAGQSGTSLALARLAEFAGESTSAQASGGPFAALLEAARIVAGLPPSLLPGRLAAFLSALGTWINWPLRWLAIWIVYGVGVMIAAKLLGARTTLQHFYAATGYAAAPLLLTGLGPIPCVGALATLVGMVWAFAVYVAALRATGPLTTGKAVLATLAPGAFGLALVAMLSLALLGTLARFAM